MYSSEQLMIAHCLMDENAWRGRSTWVPVYFPRTETDDVGRLKREVYREKQSLDAGTLEGS